MAQLKTPSLFGRATAVLGEHAALLETVGQLRELCGALRDADGRPAVVVTRLLDDFSAQLLAHFAAEEAGGYFGAVVTECPHLTPRVDRLRSEHDLMAQAIEPVRALAGNTRDHRDLADLLSDLLERLEQHEQGERHVMRDFLSWEQEQDAT
jgi:hemerythrin